MFASPARTTLWLGTAAYLALGGLAAAFFLERTVFIDLAFHSVTLLKQKTFFIQNQRFVAAFTQAFPLAAQGLGGSLRSVLMAYSLGFVAYYAAIFWACTLWLRQWKMGLLMLLLSTLMVTDTFYWVQSELPQGMALLVLACALMARHRDLSAFPGWQLGLLFGLWFAVAFAHPMLAFPTFFALFFFWEKAPSRAAIPSKMLLAAGIFVAFILLVKNKLLGATAYDAGAMSRADNLRKLFPHYFDLASNRDFLRWCLTDFYLLPLGLAGASFFYFWQKKWRKLLLINGFFFAYLLLVNVSIPESYHRFYLENLWLPLSVFVAVPLALDVLPHFLEKEKSRKWAFALLAACVAARLLNIGLAHRPWTARLDWERSFLKETSALPRKKLLLSESQVPMDKLLLSWGTSFEFMLLSALDHPDSTRLITVDEDPKRLGWATPQPRSVITEWEVWRYDQLPRRYFHPQDTTLYQLVEPAR
jgi:hypothetical protein